MKNEEQMERLFELFIKYNLTIQKIAKRYEIPYSTMRQWLYGQRKMPKYLLKLIEKDLDRDWKNRKKWYNEYANNKKEDRPMQD